jgi:hypothetical protein
VKCKNTKNNTMDINELINEGSSYVFFQHDYGEKINNSAGYARWKEKCKRFLNLHYADDKYLINFEEKCNDYENSYTHNELIGMLEAFRDLPTIIIKPDDKYSHQGTVVNVHQTQQQEQSQLQEIAINIFIESIKDQLTGKQFKEIKEIVNEEPEPEEAKIKVIEKLKSFGEDILSNIIANVITNPTIWGGLM